MFGRLRRRNKALMPIVLTNPDGSPSLDPLTLALRDVQSLKYSVKFFGYELARTLAAALPPRERGEPVAVGLGSKPSTQADMQSDWVAHWCAELQIPVVFHRKLWEYAYVLQALHDHGALGSGNRGLGFGCGVEPLPSYFANLGIDVTATDLSPERARSKRWAATNQHTTQADLAYHPHLVSREAFDAHVALRHVDMNAIPADLTGYDFCWSICALEHLGTLGLGMNFVQNSLATLRPGGVAVHTTEFNFGNDLITVDNWQTVLFQRRHFEDLAARLTAEGHHVAPLDFNVGDMPLDKFIDVPPYPHDWPENLRESWGSDAPHLKLTVDGFAVTCFGLIVTKAGGASE